ncbi:ribosome maturation factor RimM [Arthrobacter castelli]|uniref:ribosome maturation factor RimM n=1 Tax=Arthrobacter castelli TaxID=271431 RepID=UPI0003FED4B1|nr:ribosome maturation factor RimM [Arthrobacter castelli]
MQVQVARIGKPHGIRGEVTIQLMTDEPESRFVAGARFDVEPAGLGPLTVSKARWNKEILLLGFAEITDRNAAEQLRGAKLLLDAEAADDDDEDTWYEHELVGLRVRAATGEGYDDVGVVTALRVLPAQDLLVIETSDGEEVLVPFVAQLVPEVNIDDGFILVDPPEGLFDVNRPAEGGGHGS